jgi:hypothetical protein
MTDLWPDEFGAGNLTPPVKILRTQAEALTKKTNGAIVASVLTTKQGEQLRHEFMLEVPSLDNYMYSLLFVVHKVTPYPLTLNGHGRGWIECKDEARLLIVLKEIFTSEETRNIVGSLLAQAEAEGEAHAVANGKR